MNSTIKTWKASRLLLLKFFEEYSIEQLNQIPEGFNNNIIWNLGHIIVAQQGLVYKSSGHTGYISDDMFNLYKPKTKPTGKTNEDEIEKLKSLMMDMVSKTIDDLDKGIFVNYQERQTATGFHLANVTDALEFNNFHEGLHMGYIMSIRKFL
jgi:hypothetical protein